jgi:interferon gamma inducible protein 47
MTASSNTTSGMHDQSFQNIPQEEIDECQQILSSGGVKAYESFLHKKADAWKTIPLNIGIIGSAGTGKSSFINAMRDLDADDEGAADVGVVETTIEPRSYAHPNNAMMKFWDLPGVGTNLFPKESYLKKIGFENFDFFLIMTHVRFTDLDSWLSHEITTNGKKFFFVRTKIQCDIDNDRRAHPKRHKNDPTATVNDILSQIRANLQKNLGDLYQEGEVFLIDSYERNKYDFARLTQHLVEDFPKLKRQAFIFSMNTFTELMVQTKVKELRSTIWKYASLSAAIAAVSLSGRSFAVDYRIIRMASKFFFDQLALEESSLEKRAKLINADPTMLKAIVAENLIVEKFLSSQGIEELVDTVPIFELSEFAEAGFRFVPYLRFLVAPPISFAANHYILNQILDKMEEVALQVVRTVADDVSTSPPCE